MAISHLHVWDSQQQIMVLEKNSPVQITVTRSKLALQSYEGSRELEGAAPAVRAPPFTVSYGIHKNDIKNVRECTED